MERTVSTKVKKINHKKLLTNFMPLNDPNAFIHNTEKVTLILRRGADKFLARPGRKQATATKLGIYSTHSPRSSINILNRCSNFCKPLKKNQNTVHPTRSTRQQWLPHRTKNDNFSNVFSVQRTGGSPTGPDPEIGWVIKTLEAKVLQFLLGCKCPVSRGIVVQEQDPLGDLPAAFFLQMHQTSRDE